MINKIKTIKKYNEIKSNKKSKNLVFKPFFDFSINKKRCKKLHLFYIKLMIIFYIKLMIIFCSNNYLIFINLK